MINNPAPTEQNPSVQTSQELKSFRNLQEKMKLGKIKLEKLPTTKNVNSGMSLDSL